MNKKLIEQQKKKLEEEKKKLESQLTSFARESGERKGEWEAKMPKYSDGHLEEEADEVEEYSTRFALGKTLEKELRNINEALAKIKKGKYGLCDKCKKPISLARLKVYPQARHCQKCQNL